MKNEKHAMKNAKWTLAYDQGRGLRGMLRLAVTMELARMRMS
jgi:hypothetical protein